MMNAVKVDYESDCDSDFVIINENDDGEYSIGEVGIVEQEEVISKLRHAMSEDSNPPPLLERVMVPNDEQSMENVENLLDLDVTTRIEQNIAVDDGLMKENTESATVDEIKQVEPQIPVLVPENCVNPMEKEEDALDSTKHESNAAIPDVLVRKQFGITPIDESTLQNPAPIPEDLESQSEDDSSSEEDDSNDETESSDESDSEEEEGTSDSEDDDYIETTSDDDSEDDDETLAEKLKKGARTLLKGVGNAWSAILHVD